MACSYPTTVCLNVHDVVRLYMQQLCGRHLVRKGRRVDVARRRFHFALKAMLNGPPTSSCLGFAKTSIATGLPQTVRPRKEITHAERSCSHTTVVTRGGRTALGEAMRNKLLVWCKASSCHHGAYFLFGSKRQCFKTCARSPKPSRRQCCKTCAADGLLIL